MAISAVFSRLASCAAGWVLFAACAGWSPSADAAQLNNTGVAPAPAPTSAVGLNTSSSKGYPSTLYATYAVSGNDLQIDNNSVFMDAIGGAAGTMYSPNLTLASTSSVQLQTLASVTSCPFPVGASTVTCNRGTLTITYSRPVTNPILHFVGLGGQNNSTVDIISSRSVHVLTTPGVTMTMLPGASNLQVTGSTIDLINTTYNGNSCSAPTAPANQFAGCGSVRINGTVSTLTFTVQLAARRNNVLFGTASTADAYLITTSVDEDFGDAPASYDSTAAASHIVDGIRLGASVDADNTTVFNGAAPITPSPFAVAAGANNNGSAGDGTDENGLTTPLASLHTGMIGTVYTLTPSLSGATAASTVCGWIDFNRNGVFETAEGVCNTGILASATSTALNWTVPIATTAGRTYVRLRATQGTQLNTASPTGRVDSGEVEDYMIDIRPAVRVIKQLNPTSATGRFDLGIGGTAFAVNQGHNGTTGFRTLYHNSDSGPPDLIVTPDISGAAITTTVVEVPTPATTALYVSSYNCVNGAGATVATGSGTSVNITLPLSVTGAAANGRAQAVTCTFTNRVANSALSITKTDGSATYTPGAPAPSATYVITACNAAGADPANGATIVDTLPAGASLSALWTCSATGAASCSAASGGTIGGNSISLSAPTLPAGTCLTINVPVAFSGNPADY
ncbi:GEVED domain-containing protein [Pseudomonas sp. CGJS7]|uniref:GEVED domain-containing protein n=1 Tax=Pseudomonas sp. CGJS7 TaxID=3109348 RepID=UPI00300B9CD0